MIAIPVVYDSLGELISTASSVIPGDRNELSQLRHQIVSQRKQSNHRYYCGFCRDPVYLSNSGTPHFAHYSDSGPHCPWHTLSPQRLRDISARRFQGRQVSALHVQLILSIEEILRRNPSFSDVGEPDQTFFHIDGKGHRFPDLQAQYNEHKIVFELQLSSTYLPVIADREEFYRDNKVFLLWLFHRFKDKENRQTEKDIVALRSRQAFDIDDDVIRDSLNSGDLVLRCHWQKTTLVEGTVSWVWQSEIRSLSELSFDEYLFEARFADPWRDEALFRRELHLNAVEKFEHYWTNRHEIDAKINATALQKLKSGQAYREEDSPSAVLTREFKALSLAAGAKTTQLSIFEKLRFDALLDRLFFFRDGVNLANNQDMTGAAHTLLDQFPYFRDATIAVLFAYGRDEVYSRSSVIKKVISDYEVERKPQCSDFNSHLSILFPEAASYIRASCLPFMRALSRRKANSL